MKPEQAFQIFFTLHNSLVFNVKNVKNTEGGIFTAKIAQEQKSITFKKKEKNALCSEKVFYICIAFRVKHFFSVFDPWCNGSTTDFGSVS
jgi:hypothetical protein